MKNRENRIAAIHSLLEETFEQNGYPYFTEEYDGGITLYVKMKNGEYFTFGLHTPNNPHYLDLIGKQGESEKYCVKNLNDFYNKIPQIFSVLQGIDSLTTPSDTKNTYILYGAIDTNIATKFELRSLPPSSLTFNSYEELCRYCAVPDNFTDETNANDILAIIETAEKYFPVRLNELAREMGFSETYNCVVNIPKINFSEREALGLSYKGWNRIELSIKLLGYDDATRESVFRHQLRCTAKRKINSQVYENCRYLIEDDADSKFPLHYLARASSEPDYFTCNKRLITLLERFYNENGYR
jgi:hypothetical protein